MQISQRIGLSGALSLSARLLATIMVALFIATSLPTHPISTPIASSARQEGHLVASSVTDSMDDPIFASIASGTTDTRIITLTNPVGNPGITEIILYVPINSVSISPSGTIPVYGGVADCAVSGCTATMSISFLDGYELAYSDSSPGGSGKVILPAGSTILLTLTMLPESQTSTASSADSFSLSVSVYDNSGINGYTNLSPIVFYETTSNVVSVVDPSSLTQTAGVPFTFGAGDYQGGIPLVVSAFSKGSTSAIAINPSRFMSSPNDVLTKITVVDDTNETLTLIVSGYGTGSSNDVGGILYSSATNKIVVNAAPSIDSQNLVISASSSNFQVETGWANISSTAPQGDTVTLVEYSFDGAPNVTIAQSADLPSVPFTIDAAIDNCHQHIQIFAEDVFSNWNSVFLAPACPTTSQTMENVTDLQQINFPNGPSMINGTYVSGYDGTLTVIIVANVLNAQGAIISASTATVTLGAFGTASGYPIIQALPHGEYEIDVTVYATNYVTLSPTESVAVVV